MSLRWYVVQTFAGADWHAFKRIRDTPWVSGHKRIPRCTEAWWPKYDASVRRGRWELCRGTPHFPGYIFCALSQGQSAEYLRVPGVQSIICCDGVYMTVPEGVIAALKRRVQEAGDNPLDRTPEIPNPWRERQRVVIIDGPFKDFMGTIASIDKCDELKIWIDAMGRKLPVEHVPITAVRDAHQSVPRRPKVA